VPKPGEGEISMSNGLSNGLRAGTKPARGGRVIAMASIAAICSVLISACAGTEMGEKGEQGEEIGSIIGSIFGPLVPGNSVASQILQQHGDLIGGLIGGAIGEAMDEEDREALARTTHTAFESGRSQTYNNKKTGVRMSAKVAAARPNPQGQPCRTVQQEVKLKDGKSARDTVKACKGSDGWKKAG
jgi:surface antigen